MSADHKHEPDSVSLMGGLLLVLIAGLFLLGELTSVDLDARWIWPGALIAVGAVGLLSTMRSASRRQP